MQITTVGIDLAKNVFPAAVARSAADYHCVGQGQ